MKRQIYQLSRRWFPNLTAQWMAFKLLIWNRESYLYKTGWMESMKLDSPCDRDGNPLPWINFPTITFLREHLHDDIRMYEYGSGFSTLFYSALVKEVTSVEHNRAWIDVIEKKMPENVRLIHREKDIDGDYCRSIAMDDAVYDVVIVDGRDRVNCVKQGIERLSELGVVILDDSSRPRYEEAIEYAREKGFRVLHIEGLKPTGKRINRTTFFYRDANCLGL